MVVVVPALAEREECKEPVVAGVVARDVALAADNMRQRIDAESGVIEQDGAPEEADDEAGPAADEERRHGHDDGRRLLDSGAARAARDSG